MKSLRLQLSLWSGLVAGIAVTVFVVVTFFELRYALKHTVDQEMADFASDIFDQLSSADLGDGSDVMPEVLSLFDDHYIVHVAQIRALDGRRLFFSSKYLPLVYQRDENGPPVQSTWNKGRTWRIGHYSESRFELDLVADLGEVDKSLLKLLVAFALALPITFIAVVVGSAWVSRRALAPLRRVTEASEQITARELDQRIDDKDAPLEVQQLIQVLNGMMDRLEHSFSLADRFSSDASHEMRTPLTVMQGLLEQALAKESGRGVPEEKATVILDETQRLIAILESLLLLSRAQAGNLQLRVRRFDVSRLVEELEEDLKALAVEPDVTVQGSVAAEVEYTGDEGLLRQAVFNMFTNAVKHNRNGGEVRFCLDCSNAAITLEVFNTGQPIPEAARERIFDRFYRGDASRNRASGGTGLGLNLAREIVRAHGGEVTLVSSTADGTTFVLHLPTSGPQVVTGL